MVKLMRKDIWTIEENERFRELFPISTPSELARAFPDKSYLGIVGHAMTLGIRKEKNTIHRIQQEAQAPKRFSEDVEREIIRLHELRMNRKEIASKFPDYSFNTISNKMCQLGLGNTRFWTSEEDSILRENIQNTKKEILNKLPHRNWSGIACRIRILKLHRLRPQSNCWTQEEDKKLAENYMKSYDELLFLFPNRSQEAIIQRIQQLRLHRKRLGRKITDKEIRELNEQGVNDYQIAKKFSMESSSISERRKKLGLKAIGRKRKEERLYQIGISVSDKISKFFLTKKDRSAYLRGLIEADMKK